MDKKLTREEFIFYCVLCGCDYFKLDTFGPSKAMKIIEKCSSKIFELKDDADDLYLQMQKINYILESVKFECSKITKKQLKSIDDIEIGIIKAFIAFEQNLVYILKESEIIETINETSNFKERSKLVGFLIDKYNLNLNFLC